MSIPTSFDTELAAPRWQRCADIEALSLHAAVCCSAEAEKDSLARRDHAPGDAAANAV